MAEPTARVALPRLRAAWLREMGVEVLWPVPVRHRQSTDHQDRDPADALQGPVEDPHDLIEDSQDTDEGLQDVAVLPGARAPVESRQRQNDIQARDSIRDERHDSDVMLQIRMYIGDGHATTARWAMVTDTADMPVSRQGSAAFLVALMHAVLPDVQASVVPLPVDDEHAVGWLADNESFAALATHGCRVVLVGAAARRAAGMSTRLGEIGELSVAGVKLPAVALPAFSDLTASSTGKAELWRALRALAAAGG